MLTNFDLENEATRLGVPLVTVCNKDCLPTRRRNGGYIVNLADEYDSKGNLNFGTHWTAFYIANNRACYFDSFGCVPPHSVQTFLSPFKVVYSNKDIQSMSSGVCGSYCIAFLWWMSHHPKKSFDVRFVSFLNLFSSDPCKNRAILARLLSPL